MASSLALLATTERAAGPTFEEEPKTGLPRTLIRHMGYIERAKLLGDLETLRSRPNIFYLTSGRQGAEGNISADAVREIIEQLEKLPPETRKLDLAVNSFGGDGLASWRIISTIRERLGPDGHLTVLVPNYAFSAATLLALGADEIIMHPMACLGPIDPQITVHKQGGQQRFAYEDAVAFTHFLRDEGRLTQQKHVSPLIDQLVRELGPSIIGASKRSSSQSVTMAKKLLCMHMKGREQAKADAIAEKMNKSFFSHGHAVSRDEARELGLKIAQSEKPVEDLLWKVFVDVEAELQMREIFDAVSVCLNAPGAQFLMDPPPHVTIPANAPPQVEQAIWQGVLNQVQTRQSPVVDFMLTHALVESRQLGKHYVVRGKLFALRKPDLSYLVAHPVLSAKWEKA